MTCVAWCVHFPEVLSPPCLPLSPFLFLCVGWCVHLPDVLSPLSPSLSSFLSPSLSPNLSFFLFPFVVGGLILHFFKQRTVGVGFFKVSALVLDGVSAFPRSCLLYCLPLYPFFLVSLCLPLPIVPLLVSFCWMVRLPFGGSCLPLCPLVSPCVPLSPLVSPISPLDGVPAFPRVLSPFLFPFWFPSLFPFVGWCLLPESLDSSFLPLTPLLPLLVSLCWLVCPPSRGAPCLPSWSPSGVLLGVLYAFLRWPPWC